MIINIPMYDDFLRDATRDELIDILRKILEKFLKSTQLKYFKQVVTQKDLSEILSYLMFKLNGIETSIKLCEAREEREKEMRDKNKGSGQS